MVTTLLALAACAPSRDFAEEKRQFDADIASLGQQAQTAYFACRFVRHTWHCRDEVWQKQPKPHMPPGDPRQFLETYLYAAERRGAAHVLKAEGQPCDEVKSLDYFFWREGQEAICNDGHRYQIEQGVDARWHVSLLKEGE